MTKTTAMPRASSDDRSRSDLASARRVLDIEAKALATLAGALGPTFTRVLDVIAGVTGRIVVTGMGKSGHVARKIAATLSSTGTPALFVHPAEASHGDLGMIAKGDAVFALSNSGETPELSDLITYCKRFDIPVVAVTGGEASALANAADVVRALPASEEACPLGLAPTTSTTVMLALGDAIAVALLERKGFSPDQFHLLHPGGKLGRKLLKVSDIMHTGQALPLIAAGAAMSAALIEMTAKSFGCVGVVDGRGRLKGVITDGDLRRHMSPTLTEATVDQVMTKGAKSIRSDILASEAVRFMNAVKITNVFVVDGGRPVGIVHIHDCLRAGVA